MNGIVRGESLRQLSGDLRNGFDQSLGDGDRGNNILVYSKGGFHDGVYWKGTVITGEGLQGDVVATLTNDNGFGLALNNENNAVANAILNTADLDIVFSDGNPFEFDYLELETLAPQPHGYVLSKLVEGNAYAGGGSINLNVDAETIEQDDVATLVDDALYVGFEGMTLTTKMVSSERFLPGTLSSSEPAWNHYGGYRTTTLDGKIGYQLDYLLDTSYRTQSNGVESVTGGENSFFSLTEAVDYESHASNREENLWARGRIETSIFSEMRALIISGSLSYHSTITPRPLKR